MRTLKNWTARRAGRGITIVGLDASTGEQVRLVGVTAIEATLTGRPIARVEGGEGWRLLPFWDLHAPQPDD